MIPLVLHPETGKNNLISISIGKLIGKSCRNKKVIILSVLKTVQNFQGMDHFEKSAKFGHFWLKISKKKGYAEAKS